MSKKIILCTLASVFLCAAFTIPIDDLTQLIQKIRAYHAQRPQEKIYLHFDKPLYVAGEDLWFKAYHVDASYHITDTATTVVYVELFSPDKKLLKRLALPSLKGYSHGDFHLADSLPQGNYVVRAYTNYMKNQGEDFFFLREITILNSISDTNQSRAEDVIDLQFFPEGGNLISQVENRIAFKALSSGKSVAVEGEILDEHHKKITSFKTDHAGMGMFSLTPTPGITYKAKVISVAGREFFFDLPKVGSGYLMRVTTNNKSMRVIVYTNAKDSSQTSIPVYIIAQSRGIICYAAEGSIINSTLMAAIPKKSFPSGIAQITLFDAAFVPQCERLVYIDQKDNLSVTVKPDNHSFHKRTKAEIEITALNKDGTPASGNFSLSVYDAAKMPSQPYQSSIENYLLLSSDLKGNIEEPGYYLNDTLKETRYHLDLLMMTHGWRRYTWKEILEEPLPIRHYYEQGIVISGTVQKSLIKKPAPGSEVKFMSSKGDLIFAKSDSLGRFYVDGLMYYDSAKFVIQTDNAKGKQTNLQLTVNPFNPSPQLLYNPTSTAFIEAASLVGLAKERIRVLNTYTLNKETIVLKEVEVKSSHIRENDSRRIYGTPDYTLNMKDVAGRYTDIFQALQGRIPGVVISGGFPNVSISIRGSNQPPLFVIDGMQFPAESAMDFVQSIPVSDIDYIDVLKGASAAIYGGNASGGVIVIYTKRGDGSFSAPTIGIHNIDYPGFYRAKEFYSPNHSAPEENKDLPDLRTTLYWNPSIQLDAHGKATVSFYTSDILSGYEVVVEGISRDGHPGVGRAALIVQ